MDKKRTNLGIPTGFNTEIPVGEHVYHVQTEDRRSRNARVQTLVYVSGNIVGTWKTGYTEILDFQDLDSIIIALMKSQHQLVMNEVKAGKFHQQYFNKLLHEFLSSKTLEEVILEYLAEQQTTTGAHQFSAKRSSTSVSGTPE